jgi:hypothetical protein
MGNNTSVVTTNTQVVDNNNFQSIFKKEIEKYLIHKKFDSKIDFDDRNDFIFDKFVNAHLTLTDDNLIFIDNLYLQVAFQNELLKIFWKQYLNLHPMNHMIISNFVSGAFWIQYLEKYGVENIQIDVYTNNKQVYKYLPLDKLKSLLTENIDHINLEKMFKAYLQLLKNKALIRAKIIESFILDNEHFIRTKINKLLFNAYKYTLIYGGHVFTNELQIKLPDDFLNQIFHVYNNKIHTDLQLTYYMVEKNNCPDNVLDKYIEMIAPEHRSKTVTSLVSSLIMKKSEQLNKYKELINWNYLLEKNVQLPSSIYENDDLKNYLKEKNIVINFPVFLAKVPLSHTPILTVPTSSLDPTPTDKMNNATIATATATNDDNNDPNPNTELDFDVTEH